MKVISLSGGLGNQLFQIVNAFSVNEKIDLEWKLGFASENSLGEPEVNTFKLPESFSLSSRRLPTRFEIRVHHWLLAVGASGRKIPTSLVWTLKLFSCVILRSYFGKFLFPNLPKALGYDPKFNPVDGNLLVGYFHSFKWVEKSEILSQMRALEIRTPSATLNSLIKEAAEKIILIVHIRLGDYEKETELGILASTYYRAGIQRAHTQVDYDEIWVFTNDERKSRSIFPSEWVFKSRWITEVDLSASETLNLMQHGHGYVLGNSTFSWWAAMLSKHENSLVLAPNPWFKAASAPRELIPPNWIKIDSDFIN